MVSELRSTAGVASCLPPEADARCPHVVVRDVLGAEIVAKLLDYVVAHEKEFRPAVVRDRQSGRQRVDSGLRNCMHFSDLGPFEAPIRTIVRRMAEPTLARLRLTERAFAPRDFEIAAYGDGGHFGSHIDTDERLDRVRVLSCVYYFAATPPRFSGGELRLYGLPTVSATRRGGAAPFVDIVPQTDTLVAFPSWLRHEVLPVRVPTLAWGDGRFTVNCWIHRVSPNAADALGGS